MASTPTKKRARTAHPARTQSAPRKTPTRHATSARTRAPRVAEMTVAELRALIDESVRTALAAQSVRADDDDWDRQMTADAEAGRLDHVLAQVDEEIRAGKTVPLEFVGHKLK